MADFVDDLKKVLSDFDRNVNSDVEEIRRYKNELQSLTEMMYDTVKSGQYIRDSRRIILSAPEVIIGNVDHEGVLLGDGGSSVVIRGNQVSLEGTGTAMAGGDVVTRAASIRQIAVDPGKDGQENVVCDLRSEIVNQAVSIDIRSDDVKGSFIESPSAGLPGISVHSDTDISLSAAPSNKRRKDYIESMSKELSSQSSQLKSSAKEARKRIDQLLDDISDLSASQDDINGSEILMRANFRDMPSLQNKFQEMEATLCSALSEYVRLVSARNEVDRKNDAIKKMKDELGKKTSDFDRKPTYSHVSIASEYVCVSNVDGDGNIRENAEAGVSVRAPHIDILSNDKDGKLIKDSSMNINVQKFNLSTATAKLDEKREKGTYEAVGDVTVTSKNVTVQAIDNELKDKKIQEKALTKDGTFSVRAENIAATAADTEGKSTGEINLNAKNIRIASMDLDKEKRTDKEMAKSSQMVLLSEKMFTGSSDKKNKSKLVQVVSDKVAVIGDTTAEMQQGEGKAVVTLDGGNMTAGGSKVEIDGNTTFKGDIDAPNGKFKGLETSGKFKSPSISDGMTGATGAAGKPSAKMKEEESQKPKK